MEIDSLKNLKNPRFIDLRSAEEVKAGKISAQNWSEFNISPLDYEKEIKNLGNF